MSYPSLHISKSFPIHFFINDVLIQQGKRNQNKLFQLISINLTDVSAFLAELNNAA